MPGYAAPNSAPTYTYGPNAYGPPPTYTYGPNAYGPPPANNGATYVNGNLVYNPSAGGGSGVAGVGCLSLAMVYNADVANGWTDQARNALHFYRMCLGYRY